MSRTDTHRPYRVQLTEKPVASHDHTNGVCDLPTLEEWTKMTRLERRRYGNHACTWEPASWHDIKFKRNKGEGEYHAQARLRKYNLNWKKDL